MWYDDDEWRRQRLMYAKYLVASIKMCIATFPRGLLSFLSSSSPNHINEPNPGINFSHTWQHHNYYMGLIFLIISFRSFRDIFRKKCERTGEREKESKRQALLLDNVIRKWQSVLIDLFNSPVISVPIRWFIGTFIIRCVISVCVCSSLNAQKRSAIIRLGMASFICVIRKCERECEWMICCFASHHRTHHGSLNI